MTENLIYKFDAPREFQPYMEQFEHLGREYAKAKEVEGWAAGGLWLGGLFAFSAIFFPSAEMGIGLGTAGLAAAICGGVWLYGNKQSEAERYRKIWAIETYFRERGYAILHTGSGVSIYKREPKP